MCKNNDIKSLGAMISKHRAVLMGFAILYVVWYHAAMTQPAIISIIKGFGYMGVDIFLLCSGLGMTYSLKKSSSLTDFYVRRAKKILPAYYIFMIAWVIFRAFTAKVTVLSIFKNFTFTDFWTNSSNMNWYIPTLVVFYLISPVIHKVFEENKYSAKSFVILLVLSLLISFGFFQDNILVGASRLPIFVIGMYLGGKTESVPKRDPIVLTSIISVVGLATVYLIIRLFSAFLWDYGLMWYPFIVIAPCFCYSVTWLWDKLYEKKFVKPIGKALKVCGEASLEIYLIHSGIFVYFVPFLNINSNWKWCIVIAVSIAIAFLYHLFIEKIFNKLVFKKCK